MPSWFDIEQIPVSPSSPLPPTLDVEAASARIEQLVANEVAAGIPTERIVVGGFSQGGALSLWAGLQYPKTLAGVCVMSGYLAKENGFTVTAEAKLTPVAAFHGEADPTVKVQWARQSVELAKARGVVQYELTEYAGLGHGASQEEIEDVQKWLEQVLPPLDE